ncbi:Protein kinase-like domain protein [Tolypocladium capitatum]|uniref:Protein kinase-like domain protein n=1 Tax=Tolypocladium capitatum TaxID=45235 RepID=A0A2K3QP78_9HYPO|nr:Protein kinase-like domain protein [Tolypocladium capitatum]
MASPPVPEQPDPDASSSVGTPDRCLLLSDRRLIDDEFQELIPIRDHEILKVGRDPESSLFIQDDPDNLVSRTHCEVYVVVYDETNKHVYVRDRNSSNGTFVNNTRIGAESEVSSGYLLEHGDVIEIRPYWTLTFWDGESPPPHTMTQTQAAECTFFEDKYLITQRCLGQGSDGVVCLATEVATKKQLVCKMVNLKAIRSENGPEELRRKLQEADVLRQLQHPNILPYVDAMISPYSLYTFTELATGGDLWSFIHRHGSTEPIGEFDTRVIVRQVVRALQYIHSKGVIHRDLKPENILLAYSPKTNSHRVMLSDFGAYAVPRRSRMVTQAGTPNYQAPEIRSKAHPQTAAVDMWSLGIVTLALLTRHMDVGLEALDRVEQHVLDVFLDVSVFDEPGQFSSDSEQFVWRCLQVLPSDRMDAAEAQCHNWLCTPENHLERFQELDRRTMGDWKAQTQLSPMPYELPDVRAKHLLMPEMEQQQMRLSDRFNPVEEQSQTPDKTLQYLHGFAKPANNTGSKEIAAREDPATDIRPRFGSRANSCVTKTCPIEQFLLSPSKHPNDQTSQAADTAGHPVSKRLRRSKVRIQDAALLPLTDLRNNINSGPRSIDDQRKQVLEELKRANAKFLPDIPVRPAFSRALGGNGTSALEKRLFR